MSEPYRIMGSYRGTAKEELDTANVESEAIFLKNNYREAFDSGWSIWIEVRQNNGSYKRLSTIASVN